MYAPAATWSRQIPGMPMPDGCADLAHTGKAALIRMPDVDTWALEIPRLPRPRGHVFLQQGQPATVARPGQSVTAMVNRCAPLSP